MHQIAPRSTPHPGSKVVVLLRHVAALATVVGVLVEVPVMLSLVEIADRNQTFFPA